MAFVVKQYLKKNLYGDFINEFQEGYSSHPNFPSLYAVTDTFTLLGIENVAAQVPKEQLSELPDSFLAIFNQDLVMVSKTAASICVDTEEGVKHNLSYNEFLAAWNGVIVAIEPNESVSNAVLRWNSKWLLYGLPVFALMALSIFYNNYSLIDSVLLVTSIIGVIAGIFIVQEELGFKNQIVSKFCNSTPDASCGSVIKSDKGKVNKWISFSDMSLVFFSVNVGAILLQPPGSSTIIGFLSLLSLPVIAYSVWIQKFQLKKWCLLCLAVAFLVVFQSVAWVIIELPFSASIFPDVFSYLFSFIVITSGWLMLKPIFEDKIKAESAVNELKKFKRNYTVFNLLTNEIPVTNGLSQLEGLQFGNRNANITLTIILSPSCGHCHTTFQDAFDLVSKFPEKVSLKVLFNINPENNDNPYRVVVESLLVVANSNPDRAGEAISDWHIKKMGLEEWQKKWETDTIDIKATHQISQQYNWCLENEFNYTPVKIVNNKLFPKEYDISELKYFLSDFSEEKEVMENNILIEI